MNQELPVILRVQKVYQKLARLSEKLPSLKRQTLGRRLEETTLHLLEWLIMAKNAPRAHKAVYLIKATAAAEILQFHLRSLLEQQLINETTWHQLQAQVQEIGRMVGGWRKSVQ